MCPTAFLAPTLTAKICTQPQNCIFSGPACGKVIEQMVKSRYLVEFPAQKKEPKWFQNLGRFKKNSSCSVAKKSPKNWTGPCLSLNMVRRKKFIKWQTPSRNAKSSFEGANPTPPSPSGDRLPERRSYHVLWGALDRMDNTVEGAQKSAPHLVQVLAAMAKTGAAISGWQLKGYSVNS